MRKIILLLLILLSCTVFADTKKLYFLKSFDNNHRTVGKGFSSVARVSVGASQRVPAIDTTEIAVEYVWKNFVDPGVGQIAYCPDTGGGLGLTASQSVESWKPTLATSGQYVINTGAGRDLRISFPSDINTWTAYAVVDPDNYTGNPIQYYEFGRGEDQSLLLGLMPDPAYPYGSGWSNGGYFGPWSYSTDTNLPFGVYAWTYDGSYVKHFYNGKQEGSAAGNKASKILSSGVAHHVLGSGPTSNSRNCYGKHWYFALFNTAHDATRVSATSAILKSTYEVLQ